MKSKALNALKIIGALIFLLLAIAWLAGMFTSKVQPGLNPSAEYSVNNEFIVVRTPETVWEEVPASISAEQATQISSRLLARVTAIHVRAGDTVSQGQLLAELESSDLQARLRQARQQIVSLQARVTESRQNLERIRSLYEDGVVAKADLDRSQADFDALSADLEQAEQVADEANTMLSYSSIVAPIDGRIVDRFADPGDTATPGVTLLSLYNPLSLQAVAQVRERLATTFDIGEEVDVEIPALNKRFPASIQEIIPAANPTSRSFEVKARFKFESDLLPGMYARLFIPAGEEDLIAVPTEYIARIGQLNIVWVVGDEALEQRFIRTGKNIAGNRVEVTAGLEEGELIVPVPDE